MIDEKQLKDASVDLIAWEKAKCDKYDYMVAAFCGGAAGLIDVFFVGDPLTSVLGKQVDKVADGFVKKAAQYFWKNDSRQTGKNKKMPQTLEQCISYLEQAFPVNYDARYAKDLNVEDGVLSGMRPKNHHLLSLAHSPDPIGLIFSIIDQFMGYATFVDKGKIIHVVPNKTSGAVPYMQGTDLPSMLFCGFVNWIGHLLSDLVGSSSTRREGKTGRGAGIPMPFYELFLMCDFGNIDGKTLSETMIAVYEEGYDARFGATMAIPVLLNELMIKIIWMIRQKFIRKKRWRDSFPNNKHADLRIMLIVGNSTLCVVDGADAAIRGLAGENVVGFICHLNIVGWERLIMLVLKELSIRYGAVVTDALNRYVDEVLVNVQTPSERQKIIELSTRIQQHENQLDMLYQEFVTSIEKDYQVLYSSIEDTFDDKRNNAERASSSVSLAKHSGVKDNRIVKSIKDLDRLFK